MTVPAARTPEDGSRSWPRPVEPPEPTPTRPALVFQSFSELAAEVDNAGPRKWLLRGLWPAGDYGVHAAEAKAQKTWNAVDLAVSVATGTPWLGAVPVDTPGPVLMFVGEGSRSNAVRRIRAVARARSITSDDLPIHVCARAPRLSDTTHMGAFADAVLDIEPALVVLDPLYLAAGGANGADLYAMGALLERPQHICQETGTSLFVVHHFNRSEGRGASRMSGAGPAEWGRVLISATVKSRRTDSTTRETRVITELDIVGGEIADRTLRVDRRVWSDNPDDLDSALHIEVEAADAADATGTDTGAPPDQPNLSPGKAKLLDALQAAAGPATIRQLGDLIATRHGNSLRRETLSRYLSEFSKQGLVDSVEDPDDGRFAEKLWALTPDTHEPL